MNDDVLLWRAGTPLTRPRFLQLAASIARQMPRHRHLINLCEQRSEFLLAFAAALAAEQVQLLPSGRTGLAAQELLAEYPDAHVVTDADIRRWSTQDCSALIPAALAPEHEDAHLITGFTSGSTGKSQPHEKHWGAFLASVRLNGAAIRAALSAEMRHMPFALTCTVPSHHMYGVELSALLTLFGGMSLHADRPLFPADVARALGETPAPRVLVSTPLHLRALAESEMDYPPIAAIVCATAPLEATLAQRIEARLGAPLVEMFGATETCVIAARRTAHDPAWQLYEGFDVTPHAGYTEVNAAWFARPQRLQDVLEPQADRRFVLRGRNSDLVEVAGKRGSLADITRRLCAVPGVSDAIAFQPEGASGVANRVAALVVSSAATAQDIGSALLSGGLDPVFLPRPLTFVERIPRDQVGKVPRSQLLALAQAQN